MSPQQTSSTGEHQHIWFGISMTLLGLIVGFFGGVKFSSGTLPLQPSTVKQADIRVPSSAPAAAQPQAAAPQQPVDFSAIAEKVGLKKDVLTKCVDDQKYKKFVEDQTSGGQAAGVSGTPGNIILNLTTNSVRPLPGAQPFEAFKAQIDLALAEKPLASKPSISVPAIDFSRDHIRGNKKAKVVVIEYSDFQCPFCQRVHPTYKKIVETYGDKVMWVYRHFPLNFHPKALPAAIASECAYEQGGDDAFWKFTDELFNSTF